MDGKHVTAINYLYRKLDTGKF